MKCTNVQSNCICVHFSDSATNLKVSNGAEGVFKDVGQGIGWNAAVIIFNAHDQTPFNPWAVSKGCFADS